MHAHGYYIFGNFKTAMLIVEGSVLKFDFASESLAEPKLQFLIQ